MSMLDQMTDNAARARSVLHQHNIDRRVGDGAVEGNHRSLAEQGPRQARLAGLGWNHHHAVHMPLQHLLRLVIFGIRVFVARRDEDRVAILLGNRGHGVRAVGEEWIVEIGKDEADGPGALAAKGARQLIGAVFQLVDGDLHTLRRLGGHRNGSVENPRNGHRAHAGQPRNIAHRRLVLRSRRALAQFSFFGWWSASRFSQFDPSRIT
jgi:hypothetical protein